MSLNRDNLALLIDLVDNKLTSMEIFDRDDRREMAHLEETLNALKALFYGNTPTMPALNAGAKVRGRKSAITLHAF